MKLGIFDVKESCIKGIQGIDLRAFQTNANIEKLAHV